MYAQTACLLCFSFASQPNNIKRNDRQSYLRHFGVSGPLISAYGTDR